MNKTELIKNTKEIVAETLEGVTLKDTTVFVDAVIKAISDGLAKGEKIGLTGFGTFEIVERAARTVKNFQTGEEMNIPATKAPKFRAAIGLKDAVKNS